VGKDDFSAKAGTIGLKPPEALKESQGSEDHAKTPFVEGAPKPKVHLPLLGLQT